MISFDSILYTPLNQFISKTRLCEVHPNIYTFAGLLIAIPILFTLSIRIKKQRLVLLLFLFGLRAVLDMIDGSVARQCNLETSFGARLDKFADFLFHAIIVAAFFALSGAGLYPKIIFTFVVVIFGLLSDLGQRARGVGVFFYENTIILHIFEAIVLAYYM